MDHMNSKPELNWTLYPRSFNGLFHVPLTEFFKFSDSSDISKLAGLLKRVTTHIVEQTVGPWRVSTKIPQLTIKRNSSGVYSHISITFQDEIIDSFICDPLASELGMTVKKGNHEAIIFSEMDQTGNVLGNFRPGQIEPALRKCPALFGAITGRRDYGWDHLFRKLKWTLVVVSYQDMKSVKESFREEVGFSFPLW